MSVLDKVRYPSAGCVVEFFQGNTPTLAIILDESNGRLRLYTHNRREVKLAMNRLLPWTGPQYSSSLNKEQMLSYLETHKNKREELVASINIEDVWALTEGEVEKASAAWFAGLFNSSVTVDDEAAMGRALISAKSYFRFTPPDFEIYSQEVVDKRLLEAENEKARERITSAGIPFFQALWDCYLHKEKSHPSEPEEAVAYELRRILTARIADPCCTEDEALWQHLVKGLPAEQHLPFFLAQSWKIIPEHYNYLLDRAGYERGDSWSEKFQDEKNALLRSLEEKLEKLQSDGPLSESVYHGDALSLPFVSIDPASTKDRDDAFYVEKQEDNCFRVAVAIACPTLCWPFGTGLDKATQRRASSLYLPEGDEHMLPADIGWEVFSLDSRCKRPAMVIDLVINAEGTCVSSTVLVGVVSIAANLHLKECEDLFCTEGQEAACTEKNRSLPHAPMLFTAKELAKILQQVRILSGAVIIERPDPEVTLCQENEDIRVAIDNSLCADTTHFVVGEIMVFVNSILATWGAERDIPLLYRTQDVALPKEFCGIWKEPHEIAKVVRSLPPATLEIEPKRHAGLGVSAYLNGTSPIRRYSDILNQAQFIHWLEYNRPRFSKEELSEILPLLQARMDATSQIQRFRPRYWKLVFFRQQGEKTWWEGVITDENDTFVTVSLPWAQLLIRGKRKLFDEKIHLGQEVEVRLGKVKPLQNEIFILEAREL